MARAKTLKSLSFAVDFSKVQLCVLPGSLEDRHHLTGLFQRLIAGVIVLGGEEGGDVRHFIIPWRLVAFAGECLLSGAVEEKLLAVAAARLDEDAALFAHQLGGFYNLPHGECNAILLPIVEEYNLLAHLDKFINIARMMDENIDGLSKRDAAELAISAIRRLSQDVGIPASITELAKRYGKEVSRSDIPTMVANAQKDACGLTNPRKMTDAAVQQLYEIAF